MEGDAATDGFITGHGLMAYTYNKVSGDPLSQQTPHFGFLEGDGDFIFDTSALDSLDDPNSVPGKEPDRDILIKAPSITAPDGSQGDTTAETLKRLLPDHSGRIRLDDFVSQLIKEAIANLSPEHFPATEQLTNDAVFARINRYEAATLDLQTAVILLARWTTTDQLKLLEKIFIQLAEVDKGLSGLNVWLRLNWYPLLILLYSAGIAAISSGRYDALSIALQTEVHEGTRSARSPLVVPTVMALTEIVDQFKRLPDMERKYVPRSEHIFKRMQPALEDQLVLGRRYDTLFDEFEILLALSFSNFRDETPEQHCWGPPGRFVWKERGRFNTDPVYTNFVKAAKAQGEKWPPIRAGLFNGSAKRFAQLADAYGRLLTQINLF